MTPQRSPHFIQSAPLFVALGAIGAVSACNSEVSPQDHASATDAATDSASDVTTDTSADSAFDATSENRAEAQADGPETDGTPDGALPRFGLFVGSDFTSKSELAVIDLDQSTVLGHVSSDDGDTIVGANRRRGFLMQRTQGKVSILSESAPQTVDRVVDVNPPGDAGKANPYAVVVAAGNKGYVVRYAQNTLVILNLTSGDPIGQIDLSPFVADSDGLVDVFDGVFDEIQNRAYFGLQRINQTEFGAPPDYVGNCSGVHAAVVGVDVATDQIIDLNGTAQGSIIEASAVDPVAMLWDAPAHRVLLLGAGCAPSNPDAGSQRVGRGLEAVDVETATASWLWSSSSTDRPSTLLSISPTRVLLGIDDASFVRHWTPLNCVSRQLESEIKGVPEQPIYDGSGGLVGLASSPPDGGHGLRLVRLDLTGQALSVLVDNVFTASGLSAASSAIVR